MGEQITWEAPQRHCPGVSGGLRVVNNREEARDVCRLQPRPEGQDAEDRLPQTSRQGPVQIV